MIPVPAHSDPAPGGQVGGLLGSPLYQVESSHVGALLTTVVLVVLLMAALRADRVPRRYRAAHARLSVEQAVAFWALAGSAVLHLALLPGHGWSPVSLAFVVDAVVLGWAAWRLLHRRRRAAALASLALLASIAGLMVSAGQGTTPDQVAMGCKLVELAGLLALWSPAGRLTAGGARRRRGRRPLGMAGATGCAVLLVLPVWANALRSGSGHHAGQVPAAGVLVPAHEDGAVTVVEQAAADRLYAATRATLARYADPAVAARDGYRTADISGVSFHADNPGYTSDGRILDPTRPETLVYAQTGHGAVLLGAMYQMPDVGTAGPAVGGPLTVWHAHEQVCLGLLPPSIAGLTSPLGLCPAGSITVSRTNEMLHVWTVAGAPERFGDLDDDWIRAHVG